MADPASILGTAVGVTSLGIQGIQALSKYYSHFREFDDDMSAINTRLEVLGGSLEALESLRAKVAVQGGAISSQLQHAVEACASGLFDLQMMANKCGESAVPKTIQERKQVLKKRALWPFRRDTVSSMEKTLDRLQANVQLAVQLLEIEAENRSLQKLQTSTNTLVTSIEHIRNDQAQALTNIQETVVDLSQDQMSNNEATRLQLANVEKKLDMLLIISNGNQTQVYTARHTALQKPNASSCTCRKKNYTQRWWSGGLSGLFDVEVTAETEHRKTCELYQHRNSTFTCQTDYKLLKRLLNLQIRAGVSYKRAWGTHSIQPMLTVKRLVPKTSPAFSPIYAINSKIGCSCPILFWERLYCPRCSTAMAPIHLQTALNEIIQSFRDGLASPYDTTEGEPSVLNLAYMTAFQMILAGRLDGQTACKLLDNFVRSGHFGEHSGLSDIMSGLEHISPRLYVNHSEILEQGTILYSHRVMIADTWIDDPFDPYEINFILKCNVLASEENSSKYENECTLLEALYRKSEAMLHEAISWHSHGLCEQEGGCRRLHNLLMAGRHWAEGLKILLFPDPDNPHKYMPLGEMTSWEKGDLMQAVVDETRHDTLQTLIQFDHRFDWYAWNSICERSDPETSRGFLRTMLEVLGTEEKDSLLTTEDTGIDTASLPYFHAPNLRFKSMRFLLESGFVYKDEPACLPSAYSSAWPSGTPLWTQIARSFSLPSPVDWKLVDLMISNGARLDWVHPGALATPAHLVGLHVLKYFFLPLFSLLPSSFNDGRLFDSVMRLVLSCKHLDQCSCACSVGGCLPAGCTAGIFSSVENRNIEDHDGMQEWFTDYFVAICHAVELDPTKRTQFALAVLRVLTFDELGLTHTCCRKFINQKYGWGDDPYIFQQSTEDIDAIRYSERRDLEVLEMVMTKLEHAWTGYSETFMSFLKLVWLPLIRDTHERLSTESNNDIVERTGQTDFFLYSTSDAQVDARVETTSVGKYSEKLQWQWLMSLEEEGVDYEPDETPTNTTEMSPDSSGSAGPQNADQSIEHAAVKSSRDVLRELTGSERKIQKRRQSI